MRSLPDVPTLDELGYNIDVNTPRGRGAGARCQPGSAAVVDRHDEKAIKTPDGGSI